MIFASVLGVTMLTLAIRRRWWRRSTLRNGLLAALFAVTPYVLFRATQPHAHPESAWISQGLATMPTVLAHFPKTWLLGLGLRFFADYALVFDTASPDSLAWSGMRLHLGSLQDEELDVLPWFLLLATAVTWWKRPDSRLALTVLALSLLSVTAVISLAISCLPRMQADLAHRDRVQPVDGGPVLPAVLCFVAGGHCEPSGCFLHASPTPRSRRQVVEA